MDNSNGTVDNAVCSSELVNGSRDVWSCNDSDSSTADHLVIMVHGILGSSSDWKYGAEQFVRNLPDKVFVHCSERNMSRLTLDGVDVMGERLAQEVLEVIEKRPNLRKISFVAHSVGGLVARYCIGKLYKPPRKEDEEGPNEEDLSSTIGGLEAVNFITVATPHLGSRGNRQWEECLNEKYPHVVHEEHCKASDTDEADIVSTVDDKPDKIEEELVAGLTRVSWEKVDVSFHSSRQRFAAHSVIQVKDESMHREGADVVQHMIDHFVL
ncbi:Putative lipase ROG1 [Linum perenne]